MVLLAKPNHPAESRQSRLHYEARSVALGLVHGWTDAAMPRMAWSGHIQKAQRFANARFVIKRDSDGAVGEHSNITPSLA